MQGPQSLRLCGANCGSWCGFSRSFAPENGSRNQGNDKSYGQRLHEGVGHVDERVLVQLLSALDFSDLRRGGGGIQSRSLDLVDLRGEITVHEVGYEVEVENLPGCDVANDGDERDQDAAGEGAAERDLASQGIVSIAANAEVHQQERRHHHRVAQKHAVVTGPELGGDQKLAVHKDGDHEAGDQPEGENDFLHVRLLVRLTMDSQCNVTQPHVVTLSNDFTGTARKSCFRMTRKQPGERIQGPGATFPILGTVGHHN